jgi:toxin ParE1/3/4
MTVRVVIRRGAKHDLSAARDWYNAQQVELGTQFLDAFGLAIARMAAGPLRYPTVVADVHRLVMGRFPYSIYFRVRGDEVRVIAVLHQHRDPEVLQRRVGRGVRG